ncbi:MAG: TIM barrel protein [bacterium]|nr:TIM barrel protein [bacterium]MDW8163327.1 TIM barrel protein [Candidatus Omnitrophota bacterium]
MIKLSVCIEMFWKGLPDEEKIRKVKNLGFPAFEFWGWKNKDIEKIKNVKNETELTLSAFCFEPNNALTTDEISIEKLVEGAIESAKIAKTLDCKRLILTTGNVVYGETPETTRRRVIKRLKAITKVAEQEGIVLLLEPLNPIVNHKGYFLAKTIEAIDILEEVNSVNLKILYDIYHQQITEGNIISTIQNYISYIGHFHSAGVPGRHELTDGELDYKKIFLAIEKTNYNGFIGLEYTPKRVEEDSLKECLNLINF